MREAEAFFFLLQNILKAQMPPFALCYFLPGVKVLALHTVTKKSANQQELGGTSYHVLALKSLFADILVALN